MKKLTLLLALLCATMMSFAAQYCDFATGHENNASFGDANGRILLTLVPTANANEYTMTVKPNYANGATKQLDYLYVIGAGNTPYPAEAGADEGGTGYDELSVTFTNSNATASFTIQWSNPDWAGRWQCTLTDVPLSTLASCSGGSTPDPEPTEIYDVNFALQSEGGVASAKSGNDAGLANNGNTGDRWWSETAEMTDEQKNDQWWQVDLGQRRIFNTIQIVWEGAWGKSFDIQTSDDGSAWNTVKEIRNQNLGGETFPYTQTIELDANKTAQYVRFQGIERGTGYAYSFWEFRVLLPGVSVLTSIDLTAAATLAQVSGVGVALTATPKDQNGQAMVESVSYEITPAAAGHMSGNNYIPDQIGSASIRAYNGTVYSSAVQIMGVPSANLALSTNISTDNKIIAQSDYTPNGTDAFHAVDGNMGSVWQGSPTNGNVNDSREYDCWFVVDLGAYYNIALVALHFEGACSELYHIDFSANNSDWNLGYNLVGAEGVNARNDYWTELNNNTKVRYVRFWSTKAATGWGMKMYEFEVYGSAWVSGDDEKPVMGTAELTSNTYEQAVIAVTATDNEEVARYHVIDALHSIDVNCTPAAGNITVAGLTHNTIYNFTITAIDASGNESDNNVVLPVSIPFNTTINLALNQPCEAGYENTNPAESRDKANDGNDGTNWNTYADRPASEEWWYVDLGNLYTLTNITAIWGDVYSTNYILQARVAAPSAADKADDAAWVTLATITDAAANATKSTNVSGVGRYVRIHSLAKSSNFFRLRELEVYGSGVAEADAEAPVMTSASLVSNTDAQAVIAVAATDNQGIANYHVVDAGNSFDGNFVAEAGQITVTGLTGGTNYTLVITAIDFFGNESANSKSVAVTTTAHYTEPQTAASIPSWPAAQVKSLYSNTYPFAPASLTSYNATWWSWPVMTEGNVDGNTYLHYNLAADGMIGWEFAETSVASMEKLHIDIYSSGSGTLTIRPITTGGPTVRKTLTLVGQQWNSFDVELSEFPGHDWTKLFQFSIEYWNAGGLTGEHISVDNVYFYRETAIVDAEIPTSVSASIAAAGFYSVKITAQAEDNSGSVNFKVMNGTEQVATGAAATGVETTITVSNLTPGTNYNLNVIAYDEANNEAAPSAIVATTKALPASALVDYSGKVVVPVFSDAIPGAKAGGAEIHSGGWSESTNAQWFNLTSSDKVFYGQNFNYAGWHSWGDPIDATGMTHLHIDIYSNGMTKLGVMPIYGGGGLATDDSHRKLVDLIPDQWNSFDLEIATDFAGLDLSSIFQFKFDQPDGGDELMIDNVYFWKDADYTRDALTTGKIGTLYVGKATSAYSGAIFYEIAGKSSDGKEITFAEVTGQLADNTPYIFEATAEEINLVYALPSITPDDESEVNGLIGTLNEKHVGPSADIYYISDNKLYNASSFSGTATDLTVAANRCYIDITAVPVGSPSPAPGKRYITLKVDGENAATGFDQLNASETPVKMIIDGKLYILRGEKLYNANGQLVK